MIKKYLWLLLILSATTVSSQINSFFSPIEKCSDETFVRRSFLSVTGRIPTAGQAEHFISGTSVEKRSQLIDSLLQSNDYNIYISNFWGDMLRIKSEFPSNLWPNGVQAYNRWVYERIASNMPYNKIVQELLLSKGSNFRAPAVNFFRAFPRKTPENIYNNIQLLFLGNRNTTDNGKEFFTQISYKSTKEWKEEIIYLNYRLKIPKKSIRIENTEIELIQGSDWRKNYVDWLTSPQNNRFAAVMVNRLWYWIMGKGLVNEPDDWRADNPPLKPELLDYLTKKFIGSGFDMKVILCEMLLSDAFQCKTSQKGTFQTTRLGAEVLVDVIADITGVPDQYNSRVPEPFSYYPLGMRAVEIGDATVSNSGLELFGRASRDVSLESQHVREVNARQLLYLMNSSELETKIRKSPTINLLIKECKTSNDVYNKISLLVLSRFPTMEELKLYKTISTTNKTGLKTLAFDLVWVQVNSAEFLFNH